MRRIGKLHLKYPFYESLLSRMRFAREGARGRTASVIQRLCAH